MKHASEITVESEASRAIKWNSHVSSESKFKTAFNLKNSSQNLENFFSSHIPRALSTKLILFEKKNYQLKLPSWFTD